MEQKYRVVILAGGEGTRLKPITDDTPKPMLKVCGVRVIERLFAQLAESKFKSAAVLTGHMSEQVEAADTNKLSVGFFREDKKLGSAGAVRAVIDKLDEDVLIICGDAVFDFDLGGLYRRHTESGRGVTVAVTRTSSPLEYGTVVTENGVITRFSEKASWADTVTNLVSTGIYVIKRELLERIPPDTEFDFARGLFPLLMREGEKLFADELSGAWFDIGSPGDYYRCNLHYSGGENVIGAGSTISPHAVVRESVLLDNVKIGASSVDGALLCHGVTVGDGCIIPKGCVIGAGSMLEDGAMLSPNTRLDGGLVVKKGARIYRGRCFGEITARVFDGDGICCRIDSSLGVRIGHALSALGERPRIGVMHTSETALVAGSIVLGAAEAGCLVTRFGEGFTSLAAFAAAEKECDCCVFVAARDRALLFGKNGIRLSAPAMRLVEKQLDAVAKYAETPEIEDENIRDAYCRYLLSQVITLEGAPVHVGERNIASEFLFSVASALDAGAEYSEYGYFVSPDGTSAYLREPDGRGLSRWQLFLLASLTRECVFIGRETPVSVEKFLRAEGVTVKYYSDSESAERKKAFNTSFAGDGVLLSLLAAKQLRETGMSVAQARERLPEIHVVIRDIPGDEQENAEKIELLSAACGDLSRGVRINYRGGSVAVYPSPSGGFRIFAEAVSSEIAEELCSLTEKRLK